MKIQDALKQIKNGILTENPTLVMLLGMCPTLATSVSIQNAVGMGLAATAVLIGSNIAISLMRKFIPEKIRIASYIVIIAGFVTIIDLLLQAYVPDLSKSLGLYIPLIVVNCIILARAEAFASKNPVGLSAADGLGMGFGFTMGLIIISTIREVLGNGSFAGIKLFGDSFEPAMIMILPPGGFLTLGIVIAAVNFISRKLRKEGK